MAETRTVGQDERSLMIAVIYLLASIMAGYSKENEFEFAVEVSHNTWIVG